MRLLHDYKELCHLFAENVEVTSLTHISDDTIIAMYRNKAEATNPPTGTSITVGSRSKMFHHSLYEQPDRKFRPACGRPVKLG